MISFSGRVAQQFPLTKSSWSAQERVKIGGLINLLLGKGAIEKCDPHPQQFLSRIFVIPKSDGSDRLILNLRELNSSIQTEHFKLEDGKTVRQLLNRGSFYPSIDLKDAYHLIPVSYVFTKLMKPVMTSLRERGYVSVIYLDDILLFGNSVHKCQINIQVTCQLLESLGFVINGKESQFVPSVICKYLGFVYNSRNMTIELPQDKKERVKLQIKKVSTSNKCSIREYATFIGTLGACCTALTYGMGSSEGV